MAASLGASQNEITWILTSYIVASAIATPLTGWLGDRVGQKRLFILAVAGFTLASLACGIATNLDEMVLFRILQGICGAFIAPLAQTVDAQHQSQASGSARRWRSTAWASWSAPIIGPTLGGYLTETLRLALGVPDQPAGRHPVPWLHAFCSTCRKPRSNVRRFDFFGFGMLALSVVGALQLLLDRGAGNISGFESTGDVARTRPRGQRHAWVFVVHCADRPEARSSTCKHLQGSQLHARLGVHVHRGHHALLGPRAAAAAAAESDGLSGDLLVGLIMAPRGVRDVACR